MAPMTTAVELTLRPIDAMNTLNIKIQRANPLNSTSFFIPAMVAKGSAMSMMENRSLIKLNEKDVSCFSSAPAFAELVCSGVLCFGACSCGFGFSCMVDSA